MLAEMVGVPILISNIMRDINFGYTNQLDMFYDLWQKARNENGEIICPFTGEVLNGFKHRNNWLTCFAHVLPKGRFTYWKLNPANIRIVYPYFHMAVDQGSSSDRARHPKWRFDLWDQEVEKLKKEYEEFKINNLLP